MSYKTAWKFKQGRLPVAARQLPSGTTVAPVEEQVAGKGAISARVCSNDQKADLDRQVARLLEWATAQGLAVSQVVREIGSGVDEGEATDDIVRDLHEVVFSLCARLYGKRSARHRAERAVKVATEDASHSGA